MACKNKISSFFLSHKWNMFKKVANVYERIYSPTFHGSSYGVSLYRPISRSFFKLWEILHDFEPDLGFRRTVAAQHQQQQQGDLQKRPVRAAFLAEGPGGFMEAFVKYRFDSGSGEGDEYHGITLVDRASRNVPGWRIAPIRRLAREGNAGGVWLHTGEDGTGNLYRIRNVDHFVAAAGGIGSVDFVTADGGFDFSGSFNHQEELSLQLVVAQLYTAMCLQRHKGALVIKIYDIHTIAIVQLLYLVRCAYDSVRIVKPFTSRPANSEKYVVCSGYALTTNGRDEECTLILAALRKICDELAVAPFEEHETIIVSSLRHVFSSCALKGRNPSFVSFLEWLCHENARFVETQICAIENVISLIGGERSHQHQHQHKHQHQLKNNVASSLAQSIKWCAKYNIPHVVVVSPPPRPETEGQLEPVRKQSSSAIAANCSATTIAASCSATTIAASCSATTIDASCTATTIDASCSAPTIDASCSATTIAEVGLKPPNP
eukprot:gene10947-17060_t